MIVYFLCLFYSPIRTERCVVLIASPEEEWRERKKCQRSVASKTIRRDISSQMVSRNSWLATKKILSFFWWTTKFTAERSPRKLVSARGKYYFDLFYITRFYCWCRLRIVQRAKELNVRLTNAQAKSKKESTEWANSTEITVVLFTTEVRILIEIDSMSLTVHPCEWFWRGRSHGCLEGPLESISHYISRVMSPVKCDTVEKQFLSLTLCKNELNGSLSIHSQTLALLPFPFSLPQI